VPFELTLAGPPGTAGDRHTLPERIDRLGLADRVRYIGEVRGAAKYELLRTSDAYVQASHNEGMPMAVLEALAFGLPIVATDVGSLGEVITPEREGLIVPPHEPQELARAMARIAQNPNERRNMARAAVRLARRRFSESRLRDDLVRLYDGLLIGSEGPTLVAETDGQLRHSGANRNPAVGWALPTLPKDSPINAPSGLRPAPE